MVVDDSAVVRGLEIRMLESDPEISVIASVGNGQAAVQALDRHDVEVIILDIEMPVMDGLTALPKILEKKPGVCVIMSSTLTQKNAEVSLKAMALGATEYVTKPSTSRELTGAADFKSLLVGKVKALAAAARRGSGKERASPAAAPRALAREATRPTPTSLYGARKVELRQTTPDRPEIVLIGSSTGGPQALFTVLGGIQAGGGVPQPILITQHMPATFTAILAEHLGRASGIPSHEAKDGERIEGGRVYVAPGNYHMLIEARGGEKFIKLSQEPPENFCRPSVDPMFRSAAVAYGRRTLACVLTGMGADGAKGGRNLADAGGVVIAQDEATSVVWGMPGAAAHAGICSAVLPITDIASYVLKTVGRRV